MSEISSIQSIRAAGPIAVAVVIRDDQLGFKCGPIRFAKDADWKGSTVTESVATMNWRNKITPF